MSGVITGMFLFGLIVPAMALAAGPAPVDLLSNSNFVILSKTGITDTGSHTSVITGNIGSSPITAAAMSTVFCSEMSGTIYGVNAAYVGSGDPVCFAGNPPSSNKDLVDQAVLDMGTAYTDAEGRALPDGTELYSGNIGGQTFTAGLYKWSTDVSIPTDVTLSGGASDVWIFQIAGNLSIASGGSVPAGIKVNLIGGAKASNVFWQVGGVTGATLGTYSTFNGTILSAKQIIMQTGAVFNGRALAQTQVTMDANGVSLPVVFTPPVPATLHIIKTVINDNAGISTASSFNLHVKLAGVDAFGSPALGAGTPGTSYTLAAGTYVVSEDTNASYTSTFSDSCDSSGNITLIAGDNKTCTITNDDIVPVAVTPAPTSSGGGGGMGELALPLIHIAKSANPSSLSGAGSVTYTYSVANDGKVPLSSVTVADDKCSPVKYISGDVGSNSALDVDETWIYNCTKILTQTETNIATAHGMVNGYDGYETASATVIVGVPALIQQIVASAITPTITPTVASNVTTVSDPVTQYVSPITVTVSAPKFPDTGFGYNADDEVSWNILIPSGIMAVILSLYLARKMQIKQA